MYSTLSKPLFFLKRFSLSQLLSSYELPPRPSSVCERCWEGPFAMHFGLREKHSLGGARYIDWPSKFQYSFPLEQLISGRDRRCVWCAFVYEQYSESIWGLHRQDVVHNKIVEITTEWCHSGEQYDADEDLRMFRLKFDGDGIYEGLVCTAPGASKYIQALSSHH